MDNSPTISQIKELRARTELSQQAFSDKYGIPKRTIENWEQGQNPMTSYLYRLLKDRITTDTLYGNTGAKRILFLKSDIERLLMSVKYSCEEEDPTIEEAITRLSEIPPASFWQTVDEGYPEPIPHGTPLKTVRYVYACVTEAGSRGFYCNPESALIWDGNKWWKNCVAAGSDRNKNYEDVCTLLPEKIHVDAWIRPPEELYQPSQEEEGS